MGKFLSILLIAWLTGPAALAWAEAAKETPMAIKVGEPFRITVPDQSGSTGYVTVVKSLPPGLVLISAEIPAYEMKPGESLSEAPRIGAPISKVFTFVATEPTQGLLEINSARMWEKPLEWQHKTEDPDAARFFYRITATTD